MKLLGTPASPFTRRVRIVAAELGEPIDWVDTATDAGQAVLRELSPIWKVPVAIVDGRTLFDSQVIIDWLIATRGYGGSRRARPGASAPAAAIAETLNSMIQVFCGATGSPSRATRSPSASSTAPTRSSRGSPAS